MIINNKKQATATILILAFVTLIAFTPNARALTSTYNDSIWASLSVTGPDVTTPGNTEIFTVQGSLSANMSGSVRIILWLNSTSQVKKIILSEYIISGNYIAGASFIQSYQVKIPEDSANNKYIYATLDAGASHFTNLIVTLVQNPTYSSLQIQLGQLQSNISNLIGQLSALQNQLDIVQENNTILQNQLDEMTKDKEELQAQVSSLNFNATEFQFIIENIQAEKTTLQTQINNIQVDKNNLLTQLNYLQANKTQLESQIGELRTNNTALQIIVNELQENNTQLLNQISTLQAQINNLQLNYTNLQANMENYNLQIKSLEQQTNDMELQKDTTSILMYLATATAAIFIAVTCFALFVIIRKKNNPEPLSAPPY